jgi:hypothetical protein
MGLFSRGIIKLFLILGVSLCLTPTWSATARYNLSDLEGLSAEKNYAEFLEHALDIRPSERDTHWRSMVYAMAKGYVESLIQQRNTTTPALSTVERINLWPILQQDDIFQLKRAQWGLLYFQTCFQKASLLTAANTPGSANPVSSCQEDMQNFFHNGPSSDRNIDLGVRLGEILTQYAPHLDPWPFWSSAVKGPLSEVYCARENLKNALWKKLSQMRRQLPSSPQFFQEVEKNVSPQCLKLHLASWRALLLADSPSSADLAYQLLHWQKALSGPENDLYLFHYLIRGGPNGPTFDEAWAQIIFLGKNYPRREALLAEIKKLDPIPDILFSINDEKRAQVITRHIGQHFPEFLSFYTRTCIDYLSGKTPYPNGNPTVHCRDFQRFTKNEGIINEGLQQELAGLLQRF